MLIGNYFWKASCNSQDRSLFVSIYLQFVLSIDQRQAALNIYQIILLPTKLQKPLEYVDEDTASAEIWVGNHGEVHFIFWAKVGG